MCFSKNLIFATATGRSAAATRSPGAKRWNPERVAADDESTTRCQSATSWSVYSSDIPPTGESDLGDSDIGDSVSVVANGRQQTVSAHGGHDVGR